MLSGPLDEGPTETAPPTSGRRRPWVHFRLAAVVTVVLLLAVPPLVAIWERAYLGEVEERAEVAVRAEASQFEALLLADEHKLGAALDLSLEVPRYRELFLARDRQGLLRETEPVLRELSESHNITHWYFVSLEPSPTVFLRVHNPYKYDDVVDRANARMCVSTKRPVAGVDLGKTAFALRVIEPYPGEDGRPIGYVEMGEDIEHLLGIMGRGGRGYYGVVLAKSSIGREAWSDIRRAAGMPDNWDDHERNVTWGTTASDRDLAHYDGDITALPEAGAILGEYDAGGKAFYRGVFPLADVDGRVVAAFVVASDISGFREVVTAARRGMALGTAAAAVLMSLLVIGMVELWVIRPATRSKGAATGG